nr:transposase [Sinorhizobium meliloti]
MSDVKLAEALDDRGSFRGFCGFSAQEPTPERRAFVLFRKALGRPRPWSGQDAVRRDHPPAQGQSDPSDVRHACRCNDHHLGQWG